MRPLQKPCTAYSVDSVIKVTTVRFICTVDQFTTTLKHNQTIIFFAIIIRFSALTLLAERQEEYPACKN